MIPLLPPDLLALWFERSSIMEFDGNLPRETAERLALEDVRRDHRLEPNAKGSQGHPVGPRDDRRRLPGAV